MRANSMTVGWASELWNTKQKDKDKKSEVKLKYCASSKICLKVLQKYV